MASMVGHLAISHDTLVVVYDEDGNSDLLRVTNITSWDVAHGTAAQGFLLLAGYVASVFFPANEEFQVFE